MKICSGCAQFLPLDGFHRHAGGRMGRKAKCKGCTRARYYEPNKAAVMARTAMRRSNEDMRRRELDLQRARRQANRLVRLVQEARSRARANGLPFDIAAADLSIPDVCPVLGIPIRKDCAARDDNSPSLDRIVGSIGYTRGNVVVVSWRANRLKNDATLDEVLAIARYLRAHRTYPASTNGAPS